MKHAARASLRGLAVLALLSSAVLARADEAQRLALGRAVFLSQAAPPCAVCHTLAAAGARGAVGPVLDEIKPDAERVIKALRNGLGAMPSFRDTLSEAQIDAVARFVAVSTGAAQ